MNITKHIFEDSKLIYVFYALFQLSMNAITVIAIILGMVTEENAVKSQFLRENPDMVDFLNVNTVCFLNGKNSDLLAVFTFFSHIFFFVLGTLLTIILFVYIRTNKYGNMFKSTQNLQLMLLRAFSIQVVNGFIFLLFPIASTSLMVYFKVPNTGKIFSMLLGVMSIHGLADYITMLVFITPYRNALFEMMGINVGTSTS